MTGERAKMQHLDDGLIAAMLDAEAGRTGQTGQAIEAHLASCAECQHRLASARANRERAQELLRRAAPAEIVTPPFAEIRTRASRAGRRRHLPYRALGAAAVVTIAAGLGWYVRGTTMGETQPPPRSAPSATGIIAAAPEEVASDRTSETVPAPTDERAGRGAGQPTAANAPPVAGNRQDDEAAAEAKVMEAPRVALAEPQVRVEAPRREAAPNPLTAQRRAREEAAPAVALDVAFADAWRPVPRNEAARVLGGPVAVVEGVPVQTHLVRIDGGEPEVRTTQLLPGGVELELTQRRAQPAAEPPAGVAPLGFARDAVAADSVNTATVTFDGFLVTARGRVPLDSLRALLARIGR